MVDRSVRVSRPIFFRPNFHEIEFSFGRVFFFGEA